MEDWQYFRWGSETELAPGNVQNPPRLLEPQDKRAQAGHHHAARPGPRPLLTAHSAHQVGDKGTQKPGAYSTKTWLLQVCCLQYTPARCFAYCTNLVGALSTHRSGAYSTHQVGAHSTHQLGADSTHQVVALSTHQVGAHSTHQVGDLGTQQVGALNTQQVGAHKTHLLGSLSTHQVGALSTHQVGAHSAHQAGAQRPVLNTLLFTDSVTSCHLTVDNTR